MIEKYLIQRKQGKRSISEESETEEVEIKFPEQNIEEQEKFKKFYQNMLGLSGRKKIVKSKINLSKNEDL